MKFIIVDKKRGQHRTLKVNNVFLGIALAGVLSIYLASVYLGFQKGAREAVLTTEIITKWRHALDGQNREIADFRQNVQHHLDASSLRIAQLQARTVRLDALGEHLTDIADLGESEFDFSRPPALGGPASLDSVAAYEPPSFMDLLEQLEQDIFDREQQLGVLEMLLSDRKLQRDIFLAGRPVRKGWMSSGFGYRNDPMNGKRIWHNGVDFAGKEGSDVIAIAAGVVTFAGMRGGYGRMVEINHGGGYSTRYGHHKELKVETGDIVRKGALIGLMGSSGRATGPHVHFEVFKDGKAVDPSTYIRRRNR